MTGTRSYRQFCSLARALDVVGERWTLLLIRDLLAGPRRFNELLAGLPGIGANLLAARLKRLEAQGVVAAAPISPALKTKAYRLTRLGQALAPAVAALAQWGVPLLSTPRGGDLWRPQWNHVALRARFHPQGASKLDETYAFQIGDYAYYAAIRDGRLETGEGCPPRPAFTLEADEPTFIEVFIEGARTPDQALADGAIRLRGSRKAFARCLQVFSPAAAEDSGQIA